MVSSRSILLYCLAATASAAAINGTTLQKRAPLPDEVLLVFSPSGCDFEPGGELDGDGTTATYYLVTGNGGTGDEGLSFPDECELVVQEGYMSVQFESPYNDAEWEVEFFSGEGCNNKIGTYSNRKDGEEDTTCHTQPKGEIFKSFRPHLK